MTKRDHKALPEMLLFFIGAKPPYISKLRLAPLMCYILLVNIAACVFSVLPSPAMKCFELLPLLVVVFEFGLFGAVNGFRAVRQNIDEQPNLVRLIDCSGQITHNGSTISNNAFTVNNSNAGVYSCPSTGATVTVIRKSRI